MNPLITYGDSHLSLGVLIGAPAFAVAIAGLVGCAYWLFSHDWDQYDKGMARFFGWSAVAAAVVTTLLALAGFYPYSGQYHQYQDVSGTVTSINNRFLGDSSGGTSQKFVVTFDGSPQQFACNDTRCAGVREGDDLTITCKRSFQWFGTPGYDCNFVSLRTSR